MWTEYIAEYGYTNILVTELFLQMGNVSDGHMTPVLCVCILIMDKSSSVILDQNQYFSKCFNQILNINLIKYAK